MIQATHGKLHWNYFIALERDLEVLTRYIEFCEQNLDVYSIELAHLLFAAASEVDVIAKLLCERLQPAAQRRNIDDYRTVLVNAMTDLPTAQVFVPRYGLTLTPWDNWANGRNPDWWRSYNNVKHQRDAHFDEATLRNALNALGALLILNLHHYSYALAPVSMPPRLPPKDTTDQLKPQSALLRLPDDHYYRKLVIKGS